MIHLESSANVIAESSMPDCNDSKGSLTMKKLKERALFNRSGSFEPNARRDSEDSNDSMRKPASLNEIQDLYSALHDLVKTNVTTTPVPERHHRIISPSASNSSTQSSPRANNSPKLSLSNDKIYNRRKQSKEELRNGSPMKTKRGMSVGTLEIVSNLLKKSPFPTRKLSQEPEPNEVEKPNQKHVRKTARSRSEVNYKATKNSLEKENNNNKKWKLNIFKRMRSKSEAATSSSTDDEYDDCSSDGDESMISAESTMLEEDIEYNEDKTFITDSIRDIDQLVAALNLECSDQMMNLAEKENAKFIINPAEELDKLHNWYEKAAAEAVMYESKQDLLETEDNYNERDSKYNRRKSTSGGGLRRPSTIKRGTSLGQKDKRRIKVSMRKEQLPENSPLVRGQAKSTPNLREHLNNSEVLPSNNKEITKMDIFTENNLKDNSDESNETRKTHVRKVSLDDSSSRLPKSPLFYMPAEKTITESSNIISNGEVDIVLPIQYENGNKPSPRTIERMRRYRSLDVEQKKNNIETEEEEKNKTMARIRKEYFEGSFFYDSKSLWNSTNDKKPDNVRNSLHLDTGIQTDNNDNYCNLEIPEDSRPRNSSLQKEVMSILDDYIKENESKAKNTKFVVA